MVEYKGERWVKSRRKGGQKQEGNGVVVAGGGDCWQWRQGEIIPS